MKKIGLVTLYHKNYNYGGIIQAYAMQYIFQQMNLDAKLISFKTNRKHYLMNRFLNIGLRKSLELFTRKLLFRFLIRKEINNLLLEKKKRYDIFMDHIPHTRLYTEESIVESDEIFDFYVVGSDQVWNPGWWNDILLLNFTKKPKFSYAASIGRGNLSNDEACLLSKALSSYIDISVREKQAQRIIKELCGVSSELVLDPTLLVEPFIWNEIAKRNELIDNYVLVYMVGNTNKYKKTIYNYCHDKGMKVVSIGYAKNMYFSSEEKYSDYIIYDAGPLEWLGLIKYAKYVFTDSFHGSVFSIIFKRLFYCCERDNPNDKTNENSRLYSFLELTGLEKRLLNARSFQNDKLLDENIDYEAVENRLSIHRLKSKEFIKRNIDRMIK